jgi:hypothetical protein
LRGATLEKRPRLCRSSSSGTDDSSRYCTVSAMAAQRRRRGSQEGWRQRARVTVALVAVCVFAERSR